ncbi:MAG TPA: hypothetical protein DIU15_14230, partial [Deltaproteobacteria bacterium]|nr:hypothetical protein [Deltaproteobacteria bacterium]
GDDDTGDDDTSSGGDLLVESSEAEAIPAGPGAVDTPVLEASLEVVGAPAGNLITGLEMTLSIAHPDISELEIRLCSPGCGAFVVLSDGSLVSGSAFTDTTFESGGNSLGGGSSPYTGSFSPQESLGGFNDYAAIDNWTLQIFNSGSSAGTLESWSLLFTWSPPS